MPGILKVCHEEPYGGNFANRRTTCKFLLFGYYWASLFNDSKEYFKGFDSHLRIGKHVQ